MELEEDKGLIANVLSLFLMATTLRHRPKRRRARVMNCPLVGATQTATHLTRYAQATLAT
jgi:hypothetical protein